MKSNKGLGVVRKIDKIWSVIDNIIVFIIDKIFKINLKKRQIENLLQFIRFGMVGILNNLVFYVVYILLLNFGIYYVIANIIGFSISVFNAYYWNNKYVFVTDHKRTWWKTFLKTYISYAGTGILLSNVLLMVWVEILNISELIAPLINLIVTVPINYFVNKLWAYKSDEDK